jgi:hypothetical protein
MANQMKKREIKQRQSREFRVASMLAMVLDERDDNPDEPGSIRMEQARRLLSAWSSSQSSVTGMLAEILNIKAGHCVRCDQRPCPVCGRTDLESVSWPWDRTERL